MWTWCCRCATHSNHEHICGYVLAANITSWWHSRPQIEQYHEKLSISHYFWAAPHPPSFVSYFPTGGHDGPITTETRNQNSTILLCQSPGQRLPETHTHITSVKNGRWCSENSWGITPLTPAPLQITIRTQDRFHIGELSSSAERESASAVSSSQTEAEGGKPKASKLIFLENLDKRTERKPMHDTQTGRLEAGSRCRLSKH